jgi:Acyl-CoA reductase (LuxC)
MTINVLFPTPSQVEPVDTTASLLEGITADPPGGPLQVGDERVLDWLATVSRALLDPALVRRHPELGSLGFFLRRAEVRTSLASLGDGSDGRRRVPRGLVVHFPPANVDTIFVYSWAISALAGNRNIVRMSSRASAASQVVLDTLAASVVDAHPAVAATQRVISFERSDDITAALMQAADVRVLWGGDASVLALRQFALSPLAREIAFPDRSSLAAISVAGWHAASEEQRATAVEGFANDVYWFDQAACSSPRTLVWVGDDAGVTEARGEFSVLLGDVVRRRGWVIDPAMAIQKRVSTYGLAATGDAARVTFTGNAIAEVDLSGPIALQREWLGAGTICHTRIESLTELAPAVIRRDQTLSQFGFTLAELDSFITAVAGRGIDRIVPFGQALTFARTWDGLDLLQELTRIVTVRA